MLQEFQGCATQVDCLYCDYSEVMVVEEEALAKWRKEPGFHRIEEMFPHLEPVQRWFLSTEICHKCYYELYGKHY